MVYKRKSTLINKIPLNELTPGKNEKVNNDWETKANTTITGKVLGIKDIVTFKKCIGTERDDEGCQSVYKMSVTKCKNSDCLSSPFKKSRKLEKKYTFILCFCLEDEERTQIELLCYKKSIDQYGDGQGMVYGESMEKHLMRKFGSWPEISKVEITYWTRPGDDDTDTLIFESFKDLSTSAEETTD